MKKDSFDGFVPVAYSGHCIRKYMEKNKLSFIKASELWGINKNVIGNAVRKEQLTINSVIKLHKVTQLPITDFFCLEEDRMVTFTAYLNRLHERGFPGEIVSEREFEYKKCENLKEIKEVLFSLEKEESELMNRLSEIQARRSAILKEYPYFFNVSE